MHDPNNRGLFGQECTQKKEIQAWRENCNDTLRFVSETEVGEARENGIPGLEDEASKERSLRIMQPSATTLDRNVR
jgi:hypothetical protein